MGWNWNMLGEFRGRLPYLALLSHKGAATTME